MFLVMQAIGAVIAFGLIRLLYPHVTAPDHQAGPTRQEPS